MKTTKTTKANAQAVELNLVEKSLAYLGNKTLEGYATTTRTVAQACIGVELAVLATPSIWKAGRESARANVSSILAKYTK